MSTDGGGRGGGLRRPHRRVAVWLELYYVCGVVCVLSVCVVFPTHLTLGISELYDTALWKTQPTDPARTFRQLYK